MDTEEVISMDPYAVVMSLILLPVPALAHQDFPLSTFVPMIGMVVVVVSIQTVTNVTNKELILGIKKMKIRILLLSSACIILFFFLVFIGVVKLFQNSYLSPDIYYITQPVIAFSGYVENINDNVITLAQVRDAQVGSPVGYKPTQNLPARTKKIVYKIIVTKDTMFNRPMSTPPLFFASITPTPPPQPSLKDIRIGDYISAQSNTDLRTLQTAQFEAIRIDLPQISKMVTGTITDIVGNLIYLQQTAPFSSPPIGLSRQPDLKNYIVTLTSQTEFSTWDIANQKAVRRSLSDIKTNISITVYSEEDASTTTNLTALRVEPLLPAATMSAPSSSPISPTASPSAIPKTKP